MRAVLGSRYESALRQIAAIERELRVVEGGCDHAAVIRQFDSGGGLLPCAWPECKGENAPNALRVVLRDAVPSVAHMDHPIQYTTEDYERLLITTDKRDPMYVWVRVS